MATLAELRTDVRELLGDSSSEATSWSDDQMNAAINQACLDYCEKTGVSYVETTLTANPNGVVVLPSPSMKTCRVMTSAAPVDLPSFQISCDPYENIWYQPSCVYDENVSSVEQSAWLRAPDVSETFLATVSITRLNGHVLPISLSFEATSFRYGDVFISWTANGETMPEDGNYHTISLDDAPDYGTNIQVELRLNSEAIRNYGSLNIRGTDGTNDSWAGMYPNIVYVPGPV